jgi:hypothetical protein
MEDLVITIQDAVDAQCCIDGIMRFVVKTGRIAAPDSLLLKMADEAEREHIMRIISIRNNGDSYDNGYGNGDGCGDGYDNDDGRHDNIRGKAS